MSRQEALYGLLAEFDSPERLLEATKQARKNGYRRMDAYTPFQVEGLAEEVGFRFNLLPWLVLIGGFGGAAAGYFMQWYGMAISYPINVGGRSLNSWPAFIPVTFELGVLGGSVMAFLGMLALSGLPRPYHPVFKARDFSLATRNRFFLCIEASDPAFDATQTRHFLEDLNPLEVSAVEN
jgi:hypothetical protein